MINKSQDISQSDEKALDELIIQNPSLIRDIDHYFTDGPEVVILPQLEWDWNEKPDFNEEGFYLTYDHILASHPPVRDRMLYGLYRIAYLINIGVPQEESYFMTCENFEDLIEKTYTGKSCLNR